ncbi:MAG: hypothetical protein U9N53_02685 [Bacteroidota bacterium]|nr:hypothetical protein [Bacteroidota bacterium]
MKKHKVIFLLLLTGVFLFSCSEEMDVNSERFILLTAHVWEADSLMANGEEAGGSGGMLEGFTGDTQFYEDGTGYLGIYEGTWFFSNLENDITIDSDSLPIPITATIVELTEKSFKITTSFPSLYLPPVDIRMTFIAK